MTYYELWQDAIKKLDHNEITLGEYDKLIMPLHREVDTLDKIRAEIEASRWTDRNIRIERNALASGLDKALEIIDKYRGDRHET